MNSNQKLVTDGVVGSLDGLGAGDHDQPYPFGWRPRANVPLSIQDATICSPAAAARSRSG